MFDWLFFLGNSIPTFDSHMCIFKAIEENVFFGGRWFFVFHAWARFTRQYFYHFIH
ncbi:hypothetical protein LguiA_024838 [Lonicera macranthoides]